MLPGSSQSRLPEAIRTCMSHLEVISGMHTHHDFVDINDTRLYYEVAGTGQAVVLLHGFSLDTRMWDDQFLPLAQHFRVIRFDRRGFGKSALPTGDS